MMHHWRERICFGQLVSDGGVTKAHGGAQHKVAIRAGGAAETRPETAGPTRRELRERQGRQGRHLRVGDTGQKGGARRGASSVSKAEFAGQSK